MNDQSKTIRQRVIDHIDLLASPADQMKYARDVPIACVPDELVCTFVHDLFHPKWKPFLDAFTESELKSLAELYGRICIAAKAFDRDNLSVSAIQKITEWRQVMAFAKDLSPELKRGGEPTPPPYGSPAAGSPSGEA